MTGFKTGDHSDIWKHISQHASRQIADVQISNFDLPYSSVTISSVVIASVRQTLSPMPDWLILQL
jgi:hypothetical protein